jgi:pre-mRNA-splicing factor ATP-dependent RNA helicase DHX15/PRP43
MTKENPYLAHRHPTERAILSTSTLNSASASSREPLYGFVPRMVNADQVRQALVCPFNTKQSYVEHG